MSVTGATSLSGGGSSITEEPIIPGTELEPSSTPDGGVQEEEITPTPDGTQPEGEGGKPGEDKGELREDGRVFRSGCVR